MNAKTLKKLKAWVQDVGGTSAAGRLLGCSGVLVRSWVNGHRNITPAWAVEIERVSGRRILRQEIIPHLYEGMSSAA